MKRKILTTSLFMSSTILAHDLPNTFEAGQPILASEVNENFAEIESEINNMKTQIASLQNFISNNGREFVGITDSKTNGDAGGLFGLNQMCDVKFSGSTTCQSDELSAPNNNLITEEAWVQAKIRSYSGRDIYYHGYLETQSISNTRDCFSWTFAGEDNNETGFLLQTNGRLSTYGLCNIERPVACCK